MIFKRISLCAITAAAVIVSSSVFASGGAAPASAKPTAKVVDESFEAGKALLSGRVDGVDPSDFCLSVDGQASPVASAIDSFKGGSSDDLLNSMVSCSNPETQISSIVDADSLDSVVHYLNKAKGLGLN